MFTFSLCLALIVQELCESRGGRAGLPVPNSPHGLGARKATLNLNLRFKLQALVYDILPSRRKVPESDARSVREILSQMCL